VKAENSLNEGSDETNDVNKAKKEAEEDLSLANETNHLLPSRVDVSMLKSKIVSVACGGQHSVILTGKEVALNNINAN